MAREAGSGSDKSLDGLTTTEHQDIGQAVEMLMQLDQLRGRGLTVDEIGDEMAAGPIPAPIGDSWDTATVAKVLGVVDSIREEGTQDAEARRPDSGQGESDDADRQDTDPEESGPQGTDPRRSERHRSMQRRSDSVRVDPGTADRREAARVRAANHETTMPTWSIRVADHDAEHPAKPAADEIGSSGQRRRSRLGLLISVVLLFALGAGAYIGYVALTSTDDSAAVSTTAVPDPADMMAIRIEPSEPAPASAGEVAPATATIRNDGLLHLEGAFPSQADADRFIAGAANVFGAENIVESYVLNADAPIADVSDVALDKPVLFETGTATIDPSFIPFLEACGDVLKLNPKITMSIAAFSDSRGDSTINLELSQQRAEAIVDFYRNLEIADTQLVGVGYGEANPIADNESEEGREQNRRAMLQLLNVVEDEQPSNDS